MRLFFKRLAVCVTAMLLCAVVIGCGGKKETIVIEEDSVMRSDATGLPEAGVEEVPDAMEEPVVLYVHVCGAVEREGVYELNEGARIADAVFLAGGAKDEADTSAVNLAGRVTDGMQVYVPREEETAGMVRASFLPEGSGSLANADGKININTATAEELMRLNGIGERYAMEIVSYRESNGAFSSIEDIKKVHGIGEKTFEKLKDFIIV